MFGPLRTLGVPETVIDVVEPFFKVLVDLGYDRSIKPWEPTPARLIPTLDPGKVAADLVDAVGEGINNALAVVGANATAVPAVTGRRRRAIGHLRPDHAEGGGDQPNIAQARDRVRHDDVDRTRARNRTALDAHGDVDEG